MLKKIDKILIGLFLVVAIFAVIRYQQRYQIPSAQVRGETETELLTDELKVYFLAVGQGDATLIRTPQGQDILIDGGPDDTVIKKLGEYLPVNDWDIELMILTHPHSDHVTGLVEVLKRYKVDKVIMTGIIHTAYDYIDWLKAIDEKHIPVKIINGVEDITIEDKIELNILFPDKDLSGQTSDNLNNTSIVAKLIYDNTKVLFTGDLEIEEDLVVAGADLQADIYQVGHHGSNNANSLEFLQAVRPEYAIIPVGEGNWFGHPHYRTLKNLNDLRAQTLRTDLDGDIIFFSDGLNWSHFLAK